MSMYTTNEATFELPAQWADQSLNIFVVGGAEPPMHLSFVISRDTLGPGVELVDHVEKQLSDISKKLRKFRILGKRQVEVAGRPALEAEFTWAADQSPMHQRQQYVKAGQKVLVFTATAPVKISDEHGEQIEALLASVTFND